MIIFKLLPIVGIHNVAPNPDPHKITHKSVYPL